MVLRLKLYSPLPDAAGAGEFTLALNEPAALKTAVDTLAARIVPSRAVFLNPGVIPPNKPGALDTQLVAEEKLTFIPNIAGG